VLLLGILLAVVTAGTLGFLSASPRASAADPGTGWLADVQVAGTLSSDRDPVLATGAGGELFMVYEVRGSSDSDVWVSVSTNGGSAWDPAVPVAATAADETDPWIDTDPYSGRVFIAYVLGGVEILVAYSDNGVGWTTVSAHTCSGTCETPRIVSEYWNGTSNRQYIAFARRMATDDWDTVVLRSSDQGVSWSPVLESGLGTVDVRYQPAIAVQRGPDGVDRVITFQRSGPSFIGATTGYMEWSEDHGATWLPRAFWAVNVYSPPSLAAAHNGESVMIAYSTSGGNVVWGVDQDPRNLNWGTSTSWDWWVSTGYAPYLAVDGAGSTSAAVGGSYHIAFHYALSPSVMYSAAPVTMTSQADWSSLLRVSDSAARTTAGFQGKAIGTQLRAGSWHAGVAWADVRNATLAEDVYYTTPGVAWTFDSVPTGLELVVDGLPSRTPFVRVFPIATPHVVDAPTQPGGVGVRYAWSSWSDGEAQSHSVVASSAGSLTATFAEEYELTIDSSPGGLDVEVDGSRLSTPASFWVMPGTHSVSVPSPQAGAPGWRYLFSSWSDAGAQTHDVTVTGPTSLSLAFSSQVFLTTTSAVGGVTGAGWYDLGSVATITATGSLSGGVGIRYEFTGWSGDVASTSTTETVTMDAPHTVIANYGTEYELRIVSAHGNVSGAGWYAEGSPATVTLSELEVPEGGTTWQFAGWSGDATGTSATVTVTMDAPKIVTATWRVKSAVATGPLGVDVLWLLALVVGGGGLILAWWFRRRRRPATVVPPAPPGGEASVWPTPSLEPEPTDDPLELPLEPPPLPPP
jgi:hypothetical protein